VPAAMRSPELIPWDPCAHRSCRNGTESPSGAFDQRLALRPHLRAAIGADGYLARRGGQCLASGLIAWPKAHRLWGSINALLPLADLSEEFCV
jgi:hypothetical protein